MAWKGESRRHSLARKGIKTVISDKRKVDVSTFVAKGKLHPQLFTFKNNPYMIDQGYKMKEIRWSYPEDKSENYFFHATFLPKLESIKKEGLKVDTEKLWDISGSGKSYFTHIPITAIGWVMGYMYGEDEYDDEEDISIVLLRIPPKYKMEYDHKGTLNSTPRSNNYFTEENVDPNDIEIKTKGGWIPLKEFDI